MELKYEIGIRLKTIRNLSGRKQNELAKHLEVNSSLLSMFENGKREPSLSFIFEFCKYYDMSLDQFFLGIYQNGKSDGLNSELTNIGNNLLLIVRELESKLLVNNFDK
jgi:transcriptional regulator with XRE-family HTH domain